jgi:hypothetical protein
VLKKTKEILGSVGVGHTVVMQSQYRNYSKTCEIRPPLGRAKSGLISEVVLFHRMGHTKQPNGPPKRSPIKDNKQLLLVIYYQHTMNILFMFFVWTF